jgi:hypothetical protein
MLKLLWNGIDQPLPDALDVILHLLVVQDGQLLLDFGCRLPTDLHVV